MDELSAHQRDILDFEAQTFRVAGAKEQAIRKQFGLGATNYHVYGAKLIGVSEGHSESTTRARRARAPSV